jgi:small subunit ribosomal protein S2
VDTNTNPELIDFPIPANDDASKSIAAILKHMCEAIQEGLNERALDKDAQPEEEAPVENAEEKPVEKKTRARRPRKSEEAPKAEAEEAPKAE